MIPMEFWKKKNTFNRQFFMQISNQLSKVWFEQFENFWFSIDPWNVQGKAWQPRRKLLKMMTIEPQDSSTTWTACRILIFLDLVISLQAIPYPTSCALLPFSTSCALLPYSPSCAFLPYSTSRALLPYSTSWALLPYSTSCVLVPYSTSWALLPY